ncbi:hypothetical protein IV203_031668 [Nitzschia inconspicua]|uniref:Uncharacterized protein n=1 Tax=Nitzschia inconspicua TaxID=303405 RepID=A0A9K3LW36_9STRA|nr:hypothetical protein IV203_031668 [Nitzschia inconspicua]
MSMIIIDLKSDGKLNPANNDKPSGRAPSFDFYKNAIYFFLPNRHPWVQMPGTPAHAENPTHSKLQRIFLLDRFSIIPIGKMHSTVSLLLFSIVTIASAFDSSLLRGSHQQQQPSETTPVKEEISEQKQYYDYLPTFRALTEFSDYLNHNRGGANVVPSVRSIGFDHGANKEPKSVDKVGKRDKGDSSMDMKKDKGSGDRKEEKKKPKSKGDSGSGRGPSDKIHSYRPSDFGKKDPKKSAKRDKSDSNSDKETKGSKPNAGDGGSGYRPVSDKVHSDGPGDSGKNDHKKSAKRDKSDSSSGKGSKGSKDGGGGSGYRPVSDKVHSDGPSDSGKKHKQPKDSKPSHSGLSDKPTTKTEKRDKTSKSKKSDSKENKGSDHKNEKDKKPKDEKSYGSDDHKLVKSRALFERSYFY